MSRPITLPSPREILKWCAYAAVLLAPGSFLVLLALWLFRQMPLRLKTARGSL